MRHSGTRWRGGATQAPGLFAGIGRRLWGAALCAFLVSPPLLSGIQITIHYRSLDPLLVWAIAMSLLWLAFLYSFSRRPFRLHLVLLPLHLLTAADLFVMHRFGARLTSSYLSIVFTEYADAGEFIRAFRSDLAVAVSMLVLLCAAGLRGIRDVELRAPRWVKVSTAALLLVGYAVPVARQARRMPLTRALLDVAAHDLSTPVGSVLQAAVAVAHLHETQRSLEARRSFSFGASRENGEDAQEEIYVVVIGESARPDRWSLGGYERETNPRLARIGNVVFLPRYLASAAHTAVAVPAMLSLAPIQRWSDVQSQRSIVSAFREAGFDTAWLSTQEVDAWGGIVHQLAKEASVQRYFSRNLDDVLIDDLARILADPSCGKKLLVVLHTRGNHFGTTKYPSQFRTFPDDTGDWLRDVNGAYDNGILFTDFVLAKAVELLRGRHARSALFYASDHGENLADVDGLYGHGIGNRYDLSAAALFWYSDELAAAQPRKIEAGRAHASVRIGHDNLAHSLLDLAGISAAGLDASRSIFSGRFRESPRWFIARGELRQYDEDAP